MTTVPSPTLLLAAGLVAGCAATSTAQVRYTVTDLGTAQGSSPAALSDAGHITGTYFAPGGERRAFLWANGASSDVGTLGGTAQTSGVNAAGVAVGYSIDAQDRQRAVRIANGVMSDIGTLHNGVHAAANAINDSGWIAGMSYRQFGNETYQRAALWRNNEILDLGTFGGEYSEAASLNASGQVVGWAWYPLPTRTQRAFLWSEATGMIDIGAVGGGTSSASDINDQGTVVGSRSSSTGAQGAFVWTPQSGMVELPRPAGFDEVHAAAINNAGDIVGYSLRIDENCNFIAEPLLWRNGAFQLLNQLIEDPSWTLSNASDINNRGEITAIALHSSGGYRAVLLTPVNTCQADFNGDGDVGSDSDIESFFGCLAGNCCPACGSPDFNGDGDVGTDADIESFFRVLAGGTC